ncbi:extracellular solute-binding protein [Treponema primitia]|uniref:extracellular solute-binding protein n=1 Tax=Treponema primitia TaxID=88058 RepID=UPI0002D33278|nr:extracellular solute-binding protein [Treponema primitia]
MSLTVWHTYVRPMDFGFKTLVDEFNDTIGKQEGVFITISSTADAPNLNEKLFAAIEGDPGAPEIPDMAVVYPSIAAALAQKGLAMDFASQFSADEISRYVSDFVQEGTIDGRLYLLPILKSTEVLYLNKTIFDRFAAEVPGISLEQLETFEGIIQAAEKYYQWSEGKTFYFPDLLFNYTMIGMEQMGEHFVQNRKLRLNSTAFQRIWDNYYESTVWGYAAIFNSFGNYLAMTGEVACVTGTSAAAIYYPDSITYKDNTKEGAEFIVLPFPVFKGGEKVAAQRGAGMCVIKSTPAKEYAAGVFLKWFTAPAQNLRLTASTGYMPVTKQAFEDVMENGLQAIENAMVKKAFLTALDMQKEYRFYIPPVFDGFDEMQRGYIEEIQKIAKAAREERIQKGTSSEARNRQDLAALIAAFGD